jgi:hypothetical protein
MDIYHELAKCFSAWFWGDPHINTLDGGQYTFNGYGEYTMMKINFNGTTFNLQARTELATRPNGTTINATIFSAFVAKDHTNSTVQVELSRNKDSKISFTNSNHFSCKAEQYSK